MKIEAAKNLQAMFINGNFEVKLKGEAEIVAFFEIITELQKICEPKKQTENDGN